MSLEKLLATLHERAGADIDQTWQDAKAEAEKLQHQVAESLRRLKAEHEQRLQRALAEEEAAISEAARQKSKGVRLEAEERLAAKLYEIGRRLLPELRGQEYDRTFSALAAELPEGEWQQVTVNPADTETAAALFKEATITADDSVSGGMRVASADGLIMVDNSFEKRLQMAWSRLLPRLIADVRSKEAAV